MAREQHEERARAADEVRSHAEHETSVAISLGAAIAATEPSGFVITFIADS